MSARGREGASTSGVIARSASDDAIHPSALVWEWIILLAR
jgi:hypothetical protein